MRSIADVVGPMSKHLEDLRSRQILERPARLAEGHEKWGWSLDADCAYCGDTGRWPTTEQLCSCPAGADLGRRLDEAHRTQEIERRWSLTGVPRRFRGYRLSTAPDQGAASEVAAWVASADEGANLLVSGPVGTGKTGLAVGALWELHAGGRPRLVFQSVPSLLDGLRPGGEDEGLMTACRRASVLVLDDLGAEKTSDWVRERLYVLINARYEEERPTIVTSNLDLLGLSEALGERTVSRLAEQIAVVALDGDDRRRG